MSTTLEQRVTAALTEDRCTAAELAELINETTTAITAADERAAAAKGKSLDLTADPELSLGTLRRAELERDRLTAALSQLQRLHQTRAKQEHYDRWAAEFDEIKPRHAAAVEQLRGVYEEFQPQLIAALVEAQRVDAEVQRLANAKPHHLPQANGDGRNLSSVELTARGLGGVAPGHSLMSDMKLPVFSEPNRLAWPPPPPNFAVEIARALPAALLHNPGANWYEEIEERNRQRKQESEARFAKQIAEAEERRRQEQAAERAADEQRRIEHYRQQGWPL
jgi:hypothetical protein